MNYLKRLIDNCRLSIYVTLALPDACSRKVGYLANKYRF